MTRDGGGKQVPVSLQYVGSASPLEKDKDNFEISEDN